MTSEKVDVEETNVNGDMSDDELDSFLSAAEEEDEFKTEFVDDRMETTIRARSLIMYWHQLHQQVAQIKEGYSLAKMWEDEDLKTQYMEQGRPLIKKEKILNEVIKEILTELKDVAFLSQQELIQLPKWMLKTLNVRIEDAPDIPESGLVAEGETADDSGKSQF